MRSNPFDDLEPKTEEHFKLYFYAAVLHVLEQVSSAFGSTEAALQRFPFLAGYHNELLARAPQGKTLPETKVWWLDAVRAWEASASVHLPLRALREATGLDQAELALLLSIGLIDEDARFGLLFDGMQVVQGQHRPTVGLLHAWWREICDVRRSLRRLEEFGLVQILNPDAPRSEWVLQTLGALWDALRGQASDKPFPWMRQRPAEALPSLENLILPEKTRNALAMIPALLASGEARGMVVRGPQHNGRRTAVGAIARQLGRGLLEIDGLGKADERRHRLVGPLATLLHALPVMVLDLAPGESADLPILNGYDGPFAVVLGKQGGLSGPAALEALSINLDMPEVGVRQMHWISSLGSRHSPELESISESFRMTSGNIRQAAGLAQSYASLAGRDEITASDVQQASRALNRQVLDTLATAVPPFGDWTHLAVSEETLHALRHLESRCRYRELVRAAAGPVLGPQLNAGVRVLFRGPSGTGKTLAARLLASALCKDLYRIDLSAVVNKYIGETEKSLNQIFSRAEELDVILLLDEGDALLTQRTNVLSSNDRYANLETNFLLQRLESFEGILVVTTNAGSRIDSAFQRRIDAVVDFRPPEAAERWTIWQLHLPAQHAVDAALLREIAERCRLTGGQIRNAVIHASVLALDDGGVITSGHLECAVLREYGKIGSVCPLRATRFRSGSAWNAGR
jgi:hypothetical protein